MIKIHKTQYPSQKDLAKFRREYEIGSLFDVDGIIKYYGMARYNNAEALIEEDFGAVSLAEVIPEGGMTLAVFLQHAIRLAEALGEVHRKGIVHKDIKPRNIVTHPQTTLTKLIDFGISSQLSRENQGVKSPNTLEGTLAYISPEQTGRMNRAIDYRTDFYSLGATFYQMLTGKLPFEAADAMELVHCHIAQTPVPPHARKSEIPVAMSEIVMKLLEKNAERRYQSAYGLLADLQACQAALESTGVIQHLMIGEKDVSSRFEIPQKLYGREAEIAALLAAFERVSDGTKEMILVAGYSGIGKSMLVNEVHKPIVRRRGYFIDGKFDQFQRNIPYAALIQAFAGLIRQLLTESEQRIAAWKDKLLAALGPNGQVIIDVIPEVEHIIGKQPAIPELALTENQNRFNFVFGNFIRTFAHKDHPLPLFLDDLQWGDSASLALLEVLMADAETQHLFFIGAYRDNEVYDAHPLMLTVAEIEKLGATLHTITLQPLSVESLNQLVADTLGCNIPAAQPLATLVMDKTQGNPFFVVHFLTAIYAEGLIEFDHHSGRWRWEVEAIQHRDITDNVVELMANKIQRLEASTQEVLRLAACIGNSFDLHTLSIIHEESLAQTAIDLWEAIQEGLVVPIGAAYKFLTDSEEDHSTLAAQTDDSHAEAIVVPYTFLHDRVQEAAYSLIPDEMKKSVHLSIGRLTLANTPQDQREDRIFDIVNPLNLGVELLTDQKERDELARLNLTAGTQAKKSAAYQPALAYLNVGLGILVEESWQTQYDLMLALHVGAAEAAYLSGNFEQMERFSEVVLKHAKTPLDKVKVYEVNIQALIAQTKLDEAVKTALAALKLLGITLPEQPGPEDISLGLQEIQSALAGRQIRDLIDLPEMTDPATLAAMRIFLPLASASYKASPAHVLLCAYKQVYVSIQHGNAPLSLFGYCMYGLILCGILGDIDSGYEFGQLGFNLLERLGANQVKAMVCNVGNFAVRTWKEHIGDTLKSLEEGYQAGLETGALEMASYCAFIYCFHSYYVGKELTALQREIASYSESIGRLKQQTILNVNEMWRQAVLNLIGQNEVPSRLIGDAYDEEKMLPLHHQANDRSALGYLYIHKLTLHYLFHRHQMGTESSDEGLYIEGIEIAAKAEEYLDGTIGGQPVPLFYFYVSLLRLAWCPHINAATSEAVTAVQAQILEKVAANQEKMATWAGHAPMNFSHKYHLVEAERARVLGQDFNAMDHYDQAIAGAREDEYVNEEALATELAAWFYLTKGRNRIAQIYMMDTRYAYQRWGATAKVKDLEQRYPQWLTKASGSARTALDSRTISTVSSDTTDEGTVSLDLSTVLKASQTISGVAPNELADDLTLVVIKVL